MVGVAMIGICGLAATCVTDSIAIQCVGLFIPSQEPHEQLRTLKQLTVSPQKNPRGVIN